jgi:hypothetical protein
MDYKSTYTVYIKTFLSEHIVTRVIILADSIHGKMKIESYCFEF